MAARRVAVVGAGGRLGRHLVRSFTEAGDEVRALTRPEFDITSSRDLERLAIWHADVVLNAAAWTDVDACALDPERAMRVNGDAAGAVAESAARAGAVAVQVSTNEVFNGALDRPYTEDDEPDPINPYGASKLAGERFVGQANPRHLIVRTAWLFGDGYGFPARIAAAATSAAGEGRPLRVVDDEWGNPTRASWLATAIERLVGLQLAGDAPSGPYHLAGWPPTTRYRWAFEVIGGSDLALEPTSSADYVRPSRVPPRAILDVSRATALGIAPDAWQSGPSG